MEVILNASEADNLQLNLGFSIAFCLPMMQHLSNSGSVCRMWVMAIIILSILIKRNTLLSKLINAGGPEVNDDHTYDY